MKLETNRIYTLKLATGEEVVAKVLSVGTDMLEIEQPISVILGPQGLQMMPNLFSADHQHPVQLNTSCCVCVAETRDDIRNSWIEATTGIRTVSKQIITG
jgi:hypothetical protein